MKSGTLFIGGYNSCSEALYIEILDEKGQRVMLVFVTPDNFTKALIGKGAASCKIRNFLEE